MPRAGMGYSGRGQSHHLGDLRERCMSSPSGVRGDGAPAAKGFSCILNTQDDLSGQQDYGPQRFYFLLFLLPGRVVGPEVGPERKWYGLGRTYIAPVTTYTRVLQCLFACRLYCYDYRCRHHIRLACFDFLDSCVAIFG